MSKKTMVKLLRLAAYPTTDEEAMDMHSFAELVRSELTHEELGLVVPNEVERLQKTIDIMDEAHALSYPKQLADIKTMLRVANKLDGLAVSHQSTECTKEWMTRYLRELAEELRDVKSVVFAMGAPKPGESRCMECGRFFQDDIPNAPLTLCPWCEMQAREREKTQIHLTSDGGFGPRPTTGRKIGGPSGIDPDANARKDND